MARHEADREDLMREATALKPRIEWSVPGEPGVIFAGLKRTGALSVYFNQDPVYQFDVTGRLRRAFIDGYLYRTEGSTLARLQRTRTAEATTMIRHDLTPAELSEVQSTMRVRLAALCSQLRSDQATTLQSVSDGPLPDFSELMERAIRESSHLAPPIK